MAPLRVTNSNFIARKNEFLEKCFYIMPENSSAMKKIHKFEEGRLYSTLSNNNWYEPIQREGKHIVFRVRTAGTGNTWNQEADVTYVADAYGAYETVRFADGIVVKANVSTTGGK